MFYKSNINIGKGKYYRFTRCKIVANVSEMSTFHEKHYQSGTLSYSF